MTWGIRGKGGDMPKESKGVNARYVKVGQYYLNPATIEYVLVLDGGRLSIVFESGHGHRIDLDGPASKSMRAWLDQNALRIDSTSSNGGQDPYKGHKNPGFKNGHDAPKPNS
jgi:hypothetical protein